MNEINITEKLFLSLIYNISIITIDWLSKCEQIKQLIIETDYFPIKIASSCNSFIPSIDVLGYLHKKRKNLFKNIIFIIYDHMMLQTYTNLIKAVNGQIWNYCEKQDLNINQITSNHIFLLNTQKKSYKSF